MLKFGPAMFCYGSFSLLGPHCWHWIVLIKAKIRSCPKFKVHITSSAIALWKLLLEAPFSFSRKFPPKKAHYTVSTHNGHWYQILQSRAKIVSCPDPLVFFLLKGSGHETRAKINAPGYCFLTCTLYSLVPRPLPPPPKERPGTHCLRMRVIPQFLGDS